MTTFTTPQSLSEPLPTTSQRLRRHLPGIRTSEVVP